MTAVGCAEISLIQQQINAIWLHNLSYDFGKISVKYKKIACILRAYVFFNKSAAFTFVALTQQM